jgi:hypothetical protein
MIDKSNPKHWYDRAAEMRALADLMVGVETRAITLRLADEYDMLGDQAANRILRQVSRSDVTQSSGPVSVRP